jgi:hypothetical protein
MRHALTCAHFVPTFHQNGHIKTQTNEERQKGLTHSAIKDYDIIRSGAEG